MCLPRNVSTFFSDEMFPPETLAAEVAVRMALHTSATVKHSHLKSNDMDTPPEKHYSESYVILITLKRVLPLLSGLN